MKSKWCISFLSLSFITLTVFFACSKSNTPKDTSNNPPGDSTVRTNSLSCNPPDYGDSILYPKFKGPNNDFTVSPSNDTAAGKWFSWPEGLVLDPNNGTINVTQSETGERYDVAYVKNGTHDTCISQIVIGGITYLDSVYVLQNNDTLAFPIYNANPNTPPVCDNSGDTDYPGSNGNGQGNGNSKCQFDVDPPKGQANGNGVKVRTISGIINLKKSVAAGAFGSSTPANGATITQTIQYRLNDNSGKSLQKIKVQMVYYNKVSDIPASVMNDVRTKHNNFLNYKVVNGRPRPPMLIIAGFAQ